MKPGQTQVSSVKQDWEAHTLPFHFANKEKLSHFPAARAQAGSLNSLEGLFTHLRWYVNSTPQPQKEPI